MQSKESVKSNHTINATSKY